MKLPREVSGKELVPALQKLNRALLAQGFIFASYT
jgi:hypothetical protein